MVFTSPSRISRLVQNDIDRLGEHSKPNTTRKELTLPSILEVNEDPLSSPSTSTRTSTTPTDITTMSSLLQELMLTLVTASTTSTSTSTSTSSPNMTRIKVKKSSSTSLPSRLSHFDLTEHDIDGLSHISPSLATSPMRVPSRSISASPSSLAAITETNEEVMGASMEQTSALLRRLSLSLENVINSTPREPAESPLSLSCQQSQRESHTIMTSPHKLKIPLSASSAASPNISPDVSPRTHRGPMMIM